MKHLKVIAAAVVAMTGAAGGAHADLFQPDSAVSSSHWSSDYDIGNAIDGSGLPADFEPGDIHATYAQHNHWTTATGDTAGAWADFSFDAPVTIGTFHLWNHLSNNVAANPDYYITTFDLLLYDDADQLLGSLIGATATGQTAVAQSYLFAPVDDVSRVRLLIQATGQELKDPPNSLPLTGVAEVAFEAVPEPGSLALLGAGALGMMLRRARRV